MTETCSTCRFFYLKPAKYYTDCPGMVSEPERTLCRRYPEPLFTNPDDWCGEHSPKEGGHG